MPLILFYGLAVISVVLTTVAQLCLKSGASSAVANLHGTPGFMAIILIFMRSPLLWGGVVAMGLSLLTWIAALTRLEVSRAYPFTSIGIVLTILGGRWFFHEPLTTQRMVGAALIIIGVLGIARS